MSKSKTLDLVPGVMPVAWVRARMDARGVSQSDIAARAGLGRAAVSRWLDTDTSKRSTPKVDGLAALAVCLECNPGVLLGLEQPRTVRY